MSVIISDADHLGIMLLLKKLAKVEDALATTNYGYTPETPIWAVNDVLLLRGDFQKAKTLLATVAEAKQPAPGNLLSLKIK